MPLSWTYYLHKAELFEQTNDEYLVDSTVDDYCCKKYDSVIASLKARTAYHLDKEISVARLG